MGMPDWRRTFRLESRHDHNGGQRTPVYGPHPMGRIRPRAFVMMMQAADVRVFDNRAGRRRLHRAGDGCVLRQPKMSSKRVVVDQVL